MEPQVNSPVISVVIPCRGHADELENCLQGLMQQCLTLPYEIIVVDSASDPDVANIAGVFPNVRLARSQVALLPGAARNLGVQHAQGNYLAFIDADCIPQPGWLAAAITALNKGASMVGGPVLDVYPFHPIAVADNLLGFYIYSPHRPDGLANYFPGCNLALSRDVFDQLGGFPTALPAGEDTLFSSAAATRWPDRVRFVQNMQVRHTGRTKLMDFWRHQETFGFYRGRLGLLLRPIYQRFCKRMLFALIISYMRLPNIFRCVVQWHPVGLLRLMVVLPFLMLGLVAWANGFRRGCCEAAKEAG